MNADQFLKAKIDLQAEQAKHTEYTNAKFAGIATEFLKTNCDFTVGQVVEVNERRLAIQHIEPLTWFEFVIIRLYGTWLDTNVVEQNGVTLNDQIKLSDNQEIEPCPDK